LFLALIGLVTILTLGLLFIVESRQRASIEHQLQKRGETIATQLAAESRKSLLTYNFVALEQDAVQTAQARDVLYTVIHGRDGRVATNGKQGEIRGGDKQDLILSDPVSQQAVQAMATLIQYVPHTRQTAEHYDIAVPVFVPGSSDKWGTVRVGLSLHEMQMEITQTRWRVLSLGVVGVALSVVVAAFLAQRIVAPLQILTEGAVSVARGDLTHTIAVQTHDEIAVLADNFNHMTRELCKHRMALEETNRQLDHKVLELSALANYNDNILASMTSGLLTLDIDGCIETFNAMAETITGLRGMDVRGQLAVHIFADNVQFLQVLETSRQHRTPLTAPRLEMCRHDGQQVPLALRTAMLQDREGQAGGLLAIFEDLSPMQTLERRLHRADRLAALGQMAAGVAHEIKNPLASVRTFAQLVSRKHHDNRFVEKFNRIVPQELDRINFIVEELLSLARPARLQCIQVALPSLLQRVVEIYSERLQQQNIRLKSDWTAALPPLLADVEQLHRCFTNIVLNAIEAMPTGGELSILCRPVPKALIDFTTTSNRGVSSDASEGTSSALDLYATDVEVVIKDSGMGISAAQVDHVFTPFWTTKPKGTGLGLALTHKIIEEHGGTIQLTSEVGQGTTVTIHLPTSAADSPAPAQIS
jgi:two-component system sensor histidine kinase AtoS